MKRLLLVIATVGCNSVLGIPERELAPNDDTGIAVDSTIEADLDTGTIMIDSAMMETEGDTMMPVDSDMMETTVDTGVATDTEIVDTFAPDTKVDSAMDTADTFVPDTFVADTFVADTAMDTSMDTADAASCGVAGKPCCGAIPGSCNKDAVCNQTTGMCVGATGACVRASDCSGSACGGPTTCAGNICYACTPTFGTKPFGDGCTSGAQCASGVCDGFRGTCSGACSNGITGDADCTSYGTGAICTELTYTVGGGASGKIGFCAKSCQHDADCATGMTCDVGSNTDANRIDLSCTKAGTVAYGSTCPGDCIGGACVTFGATSQCSPTCTSNADCTGMPTWKNCVTANFNKPKAGTGTQPVKVCGP